MSGRHLQSLSHTRDNFSDVRTDKAKEEGVSDWVLGRTMVLLLTPEILNERIRHES